MDYLDRPGGRIAFDVGGEGPLVICVPGMGDLRSSYRFTAPALIEAGYRVVTVDLRGHGDSDTGFDRYDDEATAGDLIAIIDALGSPAALVGNSMAAGSAVIAAAARPDAVTALVLVGPFVRNPPTSWVTRAIVRLITAPIWVAATWSAYLPALYAGRRPSDFDAHRRAIAGALKRPGHARAFSLTTKTSHDAAEAVLPRVSAPALVVMGELDPDFAEPLAEATWIAERLSAEVVMVPDAGHYPHAQRPDVTTPAIIEFLATAGVRA